MKNKERNPILMDLPMLIRTPRLILTPPQINEGKIVNDAIRESFKELNRFMPWAKEIPSIEESEIFVRSAAANWILKKNEEPYLPLFMFDKETEEFIGATGYHHYDWVLGSIEIGYWIRTSYAGKGLMTEAINALTRYAFRELSMRRVSITCDINNIRSKSIPEKLGYHLESIVKSNRFDMNSNISDTLVYVRLNIEDMKALAVNW